MSKVKEAYEAKRNVYFDYEFEYLDLVEPFPENFNKFPTGMLFAHRLDYPNAEYYIYFSEELSGEELQKLKTDWGRFCPL